MGIAKKLRKHLKIAGTPSGIPGVSVEEIEAMDAKGWLKGKQPSRHEIGKEQTLRVLRVCCSDCDTPQLIEAGHCPDAAEFFICANCWRYGGGYEPEYGCLAYSAFGAFYGQGDPALCTDGTEYYGPMIWKPGEGVVRAPKPEADE